MRTKLPPDHIIFDPHHPPVDKCIYREDRNGKIWFMDIRWQDEPLSVERLYDNPHYRRWARETYSLRALTRLLITTRRKEGHQETRDETFKAIAKLLGVEDWKKVKNAANRSSKVIPKRRQQIKL
jgi:hypothetical protein